MLGLVTPIILIAKRYYWGQVAAAVHLKQKGISRNLELLE